MAKWRGIADNLLSLQDNGHSGFKAAKVLKVPKEIDARKSLIIQKK